MLIHSENRGPSVIVQKLTTPVNFIRAFKQPPGSPTSVSIEIRPESKIENFESYRELLLSLFDQEIINKEDTGSLVLKILRASNNIAKNIRRGAGNIIMISNDSDYTINQGRVKFKYEFNDALEANEMLILYEGEIPLSAAIDAPFLAQINDDGTVDAVVLPDDPNAIASSKDYGIIFRII